VSGMSSSVFATCFAIHVLVASTKMTVIVAGWVLHVVISVMVAALVRLLAGGEIPWWVTVFTAVALILIPIGGLKIVQSYWVLVGMELLVSLFLLRILRRRLGAK
jgi:hypothetical protein